MTQVKYTPGPWTQGWSKNGIDCVWLDGKTEPVIGMGDDDDWIDCGTEANARLISAAPELLEALEALEEAASYATIDNIAERFAVADALNKAHAAIAKALGE